MTKIQMLEQRAVDVRKDILEMCHLAGGPAHPGPALSSADIMTALYFDAMRVRPEEPHWVNRDRFVLSKGHGAPVLYAVLGLRGFFPRSWYATLRSTGSGLQGHPDCRKTPGVDMTSGSLGNGLSLAGGIAKAIQLDGHDAQVYVLLGDGELQEGLIWESALYCGNDHLDNLTAIVDYNHFQSCGATQSISQLEPISDKWKSFGWNVLAVNGHNMAEIASSLELARMHRGQPTAIIATTVKGKGISFMEGNNSWHQRALDTALYQQALAELDALRDAYCRQQREG